MKPDQLTLSCSSSMPDSIMEFDWKPQDGTDTDMRVATTDGRCVTLIYLSEEDARTLFNWLGAKLHGA